MAERIEKKYMKNNNKNRVRLKVKERPRPDRQSQINRLKKIDMRMKTIVSFLIFACIALMVGLLIKKRADLSNYSFEYNRLEAEIVSYELQRDRLRKKLDDAVDLNRIQRYAIEDLNMVYESADTN